MTQKHAMELITASLEKLKKNDMLSKDVEVSDGLVLLGVGSPLDSIDFVVFTTDLEERISNEKKEDFYLVLSDIREFNISRPLLSVAALAEYIVQLDKGK